MAEEDIPMEMDAIALDDSDDSTVSDIEVSGLIGHVESMYSRALAEKYS